MSRHKRSNEKKAKQLGMAPGTAANRLKKMLLFQLIQETKKDLCFQCGQLIEAVEELSIEHKTPYLNSDDPIGLFFDLNNIAFSHLSCNCSAGGKKGYTRHPSIYAYKKGCRCKECTELHRISNAKDRHKGE